MKTCTTCGCDKPEDAFYFRKHEARWTSECKSCTCVRSKQWRKENITPVKRAEWNRYLRDRRARIKDAVFGAYGGYQCKCCGESERAFLTIDHVNNDGAAFRRSQFNGRRNAAGYTTYQWLVNHGFPAGYQVLCMNCQQGKRMSGGTCPHQARRNDHPLVGVGLSSPKRTAPMLKIVG